MAVMSKQECFTCKEGEEELLKKLQREKKVRVGKSPEKYFGERMEPAVKIFSTGTFETYMVKMIDMDEKEFLIRVMPDTGASSSIMPKCALPAEGRWDIQNRNRVRINGVGKATCYADNEVAFTIRPLDKVQEKLPFKVEMKCKALLLNGKFKRSIPKYDLGPDLRDILSDYNVSDEATLEPGDGFITFDMLVGMNVLNGMERYDLVKFTKNLRLKRSDFGDAISGPLCEYTGADYICYCDAKKFKSSRKRKKRCKCDYEEVFVSAPFTSEDTDCKYPEVEVKQLQEEISIMLNTGDLALDKDKMSLVYQSSQDRDDIPPVMAEDSEAFSDFQLSNSLKRYCDLQREEMEGGDITPDQHNDNIHRQFIEGVKFVPDPQPGLPEAKRPEIKLPWTDKAPKVSSCKYVALRRLYLLLKKFEANNDLQEKYTKQINDWEETNVIERVPLDTIDKLEKSGKFHSFLPHHVVTKSDSKTTPYRVVLDGSAAERGPNGEKGLSLNDCLETGPNLLPSLKRISIRFRFGKLYYMGDISRAFLQLKLCEEDSWRLFLFWAEQDSEGNWNLVLFRFLRMPWGLNCSPFCLNAVIQHHLKHFLKHSCAEGKFPHALSILEDEKFARFLIGEIYVDDIIQTSDYPDEMRKLAYFAKRALGLGCFNLVKIESNSPEIHKEYNSDVPLESVPEHKVLGTLFNPKTDTLTICCKKLCDFPADLTYTKRLALRAQGMFYDPLGLAGPVQLKLRRYVQKASETMQHWDTPFPKKWQEKWRTLVGDMKALQQFSVPRYIAPNEADFDVHIFCDASIKGYGACAYVVHNGISTLLTSLVRIVPRSMCKTSIPRLELLSAVVASKLWHEIKEALRVQPKNVHFWTDSQTSLAWIRSDPGRYKTFVANRIELVQKHTKPEQWRFCPGRDNPADIISRGRMPTELLEESAWLKGPKWLVNREFWPDDVPMPKMQEDAELKQLLDMERKSAFLYINREIIEESPIDILFRECFFYRRRFDFLARVFATIARWFGYHKAAKGPLAEVFEKYKPGLITRAQRKTRFSRDKDLLPLQALLETYKMFYDDPNLKLTNEVRRDYFKRSGLAKHAQLISAEETQAAQRAMIQITQQHYAPEIYEALLTGDHSDLSPRDRDLMAKLDLKLINGLIHTVGRITSLDTKDPTCGRFKPLIWIPSHGILAQSIMYEFHAAHGHCGQQTTLAGSRAKYWIMSPSKVFTSIRRNCGMCHRHRLPLCQQPDAGPLPTSRRSITRPFQVIGIDFAGPIFRCTFKPPFYEPPIKKMKGKELKYKYDAAPVNSSVQTTNDTGQTGNAPVLDVPKTISGRKRKAEEALGLTPVDRSYYVMIITCANTRAVAFYLMQNLRAETVAMAWHEFVTEYGSPTIVYSDNGSNLEKFEKILRTYAQQVVSENSPTTDWRFIPAGAPWWGGFYERVVGMMKSVLYKTCEKMIVPSVLHANHLIKYAQHCINRRPLWGLSQDKDSLEVITPASFLHVDVPFSEIPETDPCDEQAIHALSKLYAQQFKRIEELWKLFHTGYMATLRTFSKQRFGYDPNNLKVGDLILYEAKHLVQNFWPIGRITALVYHPRKGTVRAVRLQKYVPNEINSALRLKKYGRRKMTPQMRRELLGYFKELPNQYPVRKIAPYEFWYNFKPSEDPTHGNQTKRDRLPNMILTKKGQKFTAKRSMYYAQDEDCSASILPAVCKGGIMRVSVRQNDQINIHQFTLNHFDDLCLGSGTAESERYADLLTYCDTTAHVMIVRTEFIPNRDNGGQSSMEVD